MRLGDVALPNAITGADAVGTPRPLAGVRILAAEQMQALPFATQLLARLGAEVVKVEHPVHGETGRASSPSMIDPEGRPVGATFLRNNLNKASVGIDLKAPAGRDLFLALAPRFDIVCENFKAGTAERLGIGYDAVAAVHPAVVYLSLSGFGNDPASPYRDWPAYASVVEAMSGIYEYRSGPDRPPTTIPVGALGDISTALFAAVGLLAALRHRERTGQGQRVDVAMLDAMVAMTDVVTHFWSLGVRPDAPLEVICEGFRADDGYVVVQVVREHQFFALGELIGRPEWRDDARFATRAGWVPALEGEIRPAVERWLRGKTKLQAVALLAEAGIAAGPSFSAPELIADPHVAARNMLVEVPRTDGVAEPVLVPGNPVKLSRLVEGPETRVPWVGEQTETVLRDELGLSEADLATLRADGVIT